MSAVYRGVIGDLALFASINWAEMNRKWCNLSQTIANLVPDFPAFKSDCIVLAFRFGLGRFAKNVVA